MPFKAYENDGGLMAEGDYEVICLKACETTTKTTGKPVIAFDFQVRGDVEQKYRRKHIFKNFYQENDEAGAWPFEKIGKLANALGIPKGEAFDLEDLTGRCCLLHMKPCKGNDSVERDCILYAAQTKAGQAVQAIDEQRRGAGYEEIDDDDLPF